MCLFFSFTQFQKVGIHLQFLDAEILSLKSNFYDHQLPFTREKTLFAESFLERVRRITLSSYASRE